MEEQTYTEQTEKMQARIDELCDFVEFVRGAFFRSIRREDKMQKRAYTAEKQVREIKRAIEYAGSPEEAVEAVNAILTGRTTHDCN